MKEDRHEKTLTKSRYGYNVNPMAPDWKGRAMVIAAIATLLTSISFNISDFYEWVLDLVEVIK